MAQNYTYPPGFSTSVNPSVGTNGSPAPLSSTEVSGINPTGNLQPLQTDASGNLLVSVDGSTGSGLATSANQVTELSRLTGSLVPTAFNEIDLTYITSGNGTGQIGTAVYKLASSTVKTLTLTYDSSNRVISVVAS